MVTHSSRGEKVIHAWNGVFKALAAEPRRQLITALNDSPPTESVTLPDAAISPMVSPARDKMIVELQHNHLPALEHAGFIEWTREPFSAKRGPQFEEAAVVFNALYDNVTDLPDTLVVGCRRLESEREAADD